MNVADGVFNPSFFIAARHIARHRFEAVMGGKVQVVRIKAWGFPGAPLEYGGFEIVVHDPTGRSAEELERVAVGSEEALHALA